MSNKTRKRQAKARASRTDAEKAHGSERPPLSSDREEWRTAVRALVAEQADGEATKATSDRREQGPQRRPTGEAVSDRSTVEAEAGERSAPAPLGGRSGLLAEAEPQAVAATYWFELGEDAPTRPFDLAVRFTGVRTDAVDPRDPRDRFERIEHVEAIPAGTARIAVTGRAEGVNPGTWRVTAAPVQQPGRQRRETATIGSRFSVLAHGPSVRLWAWPLLVGIGGLVAIALQAMLGARAGLDAVDLVVLSLVACVIGLVGGKAWYLAVHRARPREALTAGTCIQGFLVGAVATLAVGAAVLGIPIGSMLDITTPGIFVAVAIGRPGCWLTGCCAGRPTTSRWGVWASDRRVALRRTPVQLAEAALGLALGLVSLGLVATGAAAFGGQVFVAMLACYTIGRQPLFLMRAYPHTPRGRRLTVAAGAVALLADIVVPLLV